MAQQIWLRVGLGKPIISIRQFVREQKEMQKPPEPSVPKIEQRGFITPRKDLEQGMKITELKIEHPKGNDWMVGSGEANIQRVLELFAQNSENCKLTLTGEDKTNFVLARKNGILHITTIKKA